MDWAMKFLQLKYREKQSDWYGKKGLSWHLSTVISSDQDKAGSLELHSFAYLFDTCRQDWFSVSSIIENTLEMIKTQKPHITHVYLRSDEAGCYHNNCCSKRYWSASGYNCLSLRLFRATVRQRCMRSNLMPDEDMHPTILQRRAWYTDSGRHEKGAFRETSKRYICKCLRSWRDQEDLISE